MYKSIVEKLGVLNKTIATMESCTGGAVASEITNCPGASEVLKFSVVTYSNEYKIKMGVNADVIEKYSVYSMETAREMAFNISSFANSDFGVGVTGKINTPDPANPSGEDDMIYIAIYEKECDKYYEFIYKALKDVERRENKKYIVNNIGEELMRIL